MKTTDFNVCVIGLGYAGLPLAVEFSKKFKTVGFDISKQRIEELKEGVDKTNEVNLNDLRIENITFTDKEDYISKCNFIVVVVPTPIDDDKKPDLTLIKNASEIVGRNIKKGSIVVYESTVYPGVTEEICSKIIEKTSGLRFGRDFKAGYSPERINPGDKEHTLRNVVKLVSGSDNEALEKISFAYSNIISAGIYRVKNIKTAEAAKVIENIQRDLNIALVNEFSLIFRRMGINTLEVIEAAGTKWNFQKYYPGLVGGHCISVDPYYLTYKAKELGYNPQLILAGRDINESMATHVFDLVSESLAGLGKKINKSNILIMGLTFKENVPDIRNSKSFELARLFSEKGAHVFGYDPLLKDLDEPCIGFLTDLTDLKQIDCIILFSPHKIFKAEELQKIIENQKSRIVFFDVKSFFFDEFSNKEEKIVYLTL